MTTTASPPSLSSPSCSIDASSRSTQRVGIEILHLSPPFVVEHSLVVLEGVITSFSSLQLAPRDWQLHVERLAAPLSSSAAAQEPSTLWPIAASGRFKAVVRLPTPGTHAVSLRVQLQRHATSDDDVATSFSTASDLSRVLQLTFAPRTSSPHVIKLHYYQCVDGDEEDTDDRRALRRRIQMMALMVQTATAEMLRRQGLPAKTFMLELSPTDDGFPIVHTVRAASLTNGMVRRLLDQRLMPEIERDLERHGLHDRSTTKHVVFYGASRYIASEGRAEAQVSESDHRYMAVMGTCATFAWPERVEEIISCALNTTRIDRSIYYEDGWNSYAEHAWCGNLAVSLSRVLYWIGRTLGIPIALSGIMDDESEEFDLLRVFSVFEPDASTFEPVFSRAAENPQQLIINHDLVKEVEELGGAHWNPVSAMRLLASPWITGESIPRPALPPGIVWTPELIGPVGYGEFQGLQHRFYEAIEDRDDDSLGAIVIESDRFIHSINAMSRKQMAAMTPSDLESRGARNVVQLAEDEYVTAVEVRAMAWIDAIRIHTNHRKTRLFGGTGGFVHKLHAAPGDKIIGFFGSHGASFIGRLGAVCRPMSKSESLKGASAPHCFSKESHQEVGATAELGLQLLKCSPLPRHHFSLVATKEAGAIVVQCGYFVESLRFVSTDELADITSVLDKQLLRPDERVVDCPLRNGEFFVGATVRHGQWIHGIQFFTNLGRVTPWYGTTEAPHEKTLICPSGQRLCGFFGKRGKRFIHTLGLYHVPWNGQSQPIPSVAERAHTNKAFSVLGRSDSLPVGAEDELDLAIGILVIVRDRRIEIVRSISPDEGAMAYNIDEVVPDSQRRFVFWCEPGELFTQIDVCVDGSSAATEPPSIVGVCFHTTRRCSSWIGKFDRAHVHFFVTPPSFCIASIRCQTLKTVAGDALRLTDLYGILVARSHVGGKTKSSKLHQLPWSVKVDKGSYDVRAYSSDASVGILGIALLDKSMYEVDGWIWNRARDGPHPHMWCLPRRLIESHLRSEDGDRDRKQILGEDVSQEERCVRKRGHSHKKLADNFSLAAIDVSGQFVKAHAPVLGVHMNYGF
ncbi:hypothetical protein PINS_up015294 [Pythium insidiosum]|nr:hypothetical protein PINS_up015294 [Pythium insidiosum]